MADPYPPIRPITPGPKHHWFGYYDKLQIDPANRYALGMEVDFEHRSPMAEDVITLGIIDMESGDVWTEIAQTNAWCWQQGCMLQWVPGSQTDIIWNDREGDRFVSHIYNTQTQAKRTLPHAVYTLSPNGNTAIGTDFRRINHMRPGYGYAGLPDPNHDVLAPKDTGIYTVDLTTGESNLIIPIAEAQRVHPWENKKAPKEPFRAFLYA